MTTKDILTRLFWTVLAAAGGALAASQTLDIPAVKAAGMVAATAAINYLTLIARSKAAPLPPAGE